MKIFKILVEVENCWLKIDGGKKLAAGFTTRGTAANSEDEAKSIIEGQLNEELRPLILNHSQDPPRFNYQEVLESTRKHVEELPTSGFTWYLINIH